MGSLELPRHWKIDMRFRTWNARSSSRENLLKTVASEMAKHNLDLVAVQNVRWLEGGSQPADDYTVFPGNGSAKYYLGTGFLYIRKSY
jgi:exonuclease III